MNFSEIIRKRIREVRNEKHLTQQQLADTVGVYRETIAAWEAGKQTPSVDAIDKVADALNVAVWDLCMPLEVRRTQTDIEDCFLRVMDYTRDKIIEDLQRLGKQSRLNVTPIGNETPAKKDVG